MYNGSIGTHWICSVGSERACMYFDSYGSPCPQEIDKFIKAKYRQYGYNNFIIQDINATSCGWYCIAFALYVKLNQHKYKKDLLQCCNAFINMFGDDNKRNEGVLKTYLFSVFDKLGKRKALSGYL